MRGWVWMEGCVQTRESETHAKEKWEPNGHGHRKSHCNDYSLGIVCDFFLAFKPEGCVAKRKAVTWLGGGG